MKNENKIFNFLYGFLLLLGINQIILTPCILLHTSFSIPFWLSILICLLLLGFSYYIEKPNYKDVLKNIPKLSKKYIITIIMCLLVLTQITLTTITYKSNADDSYYVSLSTTNIDTNKVYIEEPSMGYESERSTLFATEQIPSFELQVGIWSKISGINPAIICHSLLPMIIVFISYISYYYFANIFMDSKKSKIFLIILSIIFLCTGFSIRFRPGYLLTRTWQGKTIFLNIGLTMIIAALMKNEKILLVISNIFSLSLSSTAVFLIPFVYLGFGIIKLVKLKWKEIIDLVLTFIPVIIYMIIYFLLNRNAQEVFSPPQGEVSMFKVLSNYGSYIYLAYYVIATIIIMFKGNKNAKKYFGYIQIINLLTIWNPLFSNFIAKYFTSSATFWRVLWLLPIEFAISYFTVEMLDKVNKNKWKVIILGLVLVLLVVPGKFVYSLELAENLENIPSYIMEQTNYILEQDREKEKIMVLAPPEPLHSTMMRQVTSKIKLIQSRDTYMGKIPTIQEQTERLNLAKMYNNEFIYTVEEIEQLIKKYEIDWIIVDSRNEKMLEYIDRTFMNKNSEISGYILYSN